MPRHSGTMVGMGRDIYIGDQALDEETLGERIHGLTEDVIAQAGTPAPDAGRRNAISARVKILVLDQARNGAFRESDFSALDRQICEAAEREAAAWQHALKDIYADFDELLAEMEAPIRKYLQSHYFREASQLPSLDDACQETWLLMFKKWSEGKVPACKGQARQFVYTAAKRRASRVLVNDRKTAPAEDVLGPDWASRIDAGNTASPVRPATVQRPAGDRIHEAVERLPQKLRSVVIAHYFEERSAKAIMAEDSISKSDFYRRITEAMAKLRRLMEKTCDG